MHIIPSSRVAFELYCVIPYILLWRLRYIGFRIVIITLHKSRFLKTELVLGTMNWVIGFFGLHGNSGKGSKLRQRAGCPRL